MLDWWFDLPVWLRYTAALALAGISAAIFISSQGKNRVAGFGIALGIALFIFADAGETTRY